MELDIETLGAFALAVGSIVLNLYQKRGAKTIASDLSTAQDTISELRAELADLLADNTATIAAKTVAADVEALTTNTATIPATEYTLTDVSTAAEGLPAQDAQGMAVGDIEIFDVFSNLNHDLTFGPTDKDHVFLLLTHMKGGNATLGIGVDGIVCPECTVHFDVMPSKKGKIIKYALPMPNITAGKHQITILEGWKTNTLSYDQIEWIESYGPVEIEVV